MKILIFLILTHLAASVLANTSSNNTQTFRITCKAEYRDEKGNVKEKTYPVTLYGHFDDPDEKCKKACYEKDCKVIKFFI